MTQAWFRGLFLTIGIFMVAGVGATALAGLTETNAFAADQVGTLTQIEGEVKVFTHPSKTFDKDQLGPPPHALFEGNYYSVQSAKVGDKVEKGNVVRTAPGAKARVVYDNGDQFNIGSATAYRVTWDKDAAGGKTDVSLMYGKLRGIIAKGGPRSKMTVRTKSAVMGVRGTDFFIGDSGPDGGTEISVLRGQVDAKSLSGSARSLQVKSGQTAEIAAAPAPQTGEKAASAPAPVVVKTSQEDLAAIERATEVKIDTKKEMEQLEKKADETTLNDIKAGDPKLYAEISSGSKKTSAELNAISVAELQKVAPKAPPGRHKPFKSELEDLEKGAYEKYFKVVD